MKAYTIRDGHTFVGTDAKGEPRRWGGGEVIELDDDVARVHADKLDPVASKPDAAAKAAAAAPAVPKV